MFKEFSSWIAWTDSMKENDSFFGLIEYQRKQPGAGVNILWVIALNSTNESEAELMADQVLLQISDINNKGRIIYNDGVML